LGEVGGAETDEERGKDKEEKGQRGRGGKTAHGGIGDGKGDRYLHPLPRNPKSAYGDLPIRALASAVSRALLELATRYRFGFK